MRSAREERITQHENETKYEREQHFTIAELWEEAMPQTALQSTRMKQTTDSRQQTQLLGHTAYIKKLTLQGLGKGQKATPLEKTIKQMGTDGQDDIWKTTRCSKQATIRRFTL